MAGETIGDLLARDRRSDRTALEDATGREYDYHWLCTSSWKAGNFLRHTGVRRGVTVGVSGDGPIALLAFFGTALLEGTTWFDPPTALADRADVRSLVAPAAEIDRYELPRGAQRVGYGAEPEDPGVHHFDAGLWSENPSFPPIEADPDTPSLTDGERSYSHGSLLAAARTVAEEYGLEPGDRVAVRAPLTNPRTVAAGLLAPLLVEGSIVLDRDEGGDSRADLVVSTAEAAGYRRVDPSTIDLP